MSSGMLVYDAILVICLFEMQQELHQCIQKKDWLGFYLMIVILVVSLTGAVLLNVSYYGH